MNRAYYGKGNILGSETAGQTIHEILNCLTLELSNLLKSQISYLSLAQDLACNIFPLCHRYKTINPLYSPKIILKGMKNSFIKDAIAEWFKFNPTKKLTKTVLKKLNSQQGVSELTLSILFRQQSRFSIEDTIALLNLDFYTAFPTQTYKLLSNYDMHQIFQLITTSITSPIKYLELAKLLYLEIIDLESNYKIPESPKTSKHLYDLLKADLDAIKAEASQQKEEERLQSAMQLQRLFDSN